MVQLQYESAEDQSSQLSDILANLKIDKSSSLHSDTAILHEIDTAIVNYSKILWDLYVLAHWISYEMENWEEHEYKCLDFVCAQYEKFDERRAPLENTQKILRDQLIMLQKNHPQYFDKINNDRIPSVFFIAANEHQSEVSGNPWAGWD